MELVRVTLIASDTEVRLVATLEVLIETTQDFTDSAYTTHDHRQHVLMICEQLRHQLAVLLRVGTALVSIPYVVELNSMNCSLCLCLLFRL